MSDVVTMTTEKRAQALANLDRAIGTLLNLTIEDRVVAQTLKVAANKIREIQQSEMRQ